MSHADKARQSNDPFAYCICHFSMRSYDRGMRTVTFKFDDESSITLKITYEVLS